MAKKVLGLILELNPFHNGHKYFIDEAKKLVNSDVTIATVTSSFSMRGDVMVMDKFTKTKTCLDNGIDLVLELPYLGGTCASDFFSFNNIKILNEFKVTDICFGVENDDLKLLKYINDLTSSDEFNYLVKDYLDQGNSYSLAHTKALMVLSNDKDIVSIYNQPNNTLALAYLKAIDIINPNIKVHLIKRINNDYFDEKVNTSSIQSALAIRNLMKDKKDFKDYVINKEYNYIDINKANDELLLLLKYQFAINPIDYFKDILLVNEGIENRIYSNLDKAKSFDELVNLVITKRYSANYIKRLLLNIILDVKANKNITDYLRILGFSDIGNSYLSKLNKETKAKIFSSMKNRTDLESMIELKATKVYGLITDNPYLYLEEFKLPIKKESE